MLATRSVSSPPSPRDGLRLLVTRYRGRGLPSDRYHVWLANLGPSEELLQSALKGQIPWREFARRYSRELFEPGGVDARNPTIRNRGQLHCLRLVKHLAQTGDVTLLCHCDEAATECHRFLLRDLILGAKV